MSDRAGDVWKSDMVRRAESTAINVPWTPAGDGGGPSAYPGSSEAGWANRLACRNHGYSELTDLSGCQANAPTDTNLSAGINTEIQRGLASVETQVSTCRAQVKALEDRKNALDVYSHR